MKGARILKNSIIIFIAAVILNSCAGLKILTPTDKDIVNTLEPTFTWNYPTKEDIAFELKIAEDANLQTNIKLFRVEQKMRFTLTIPYLKPGKKYFWSVRAIYYDEKFGDYVTTPWAMEDEKTGTPFSFTTSQGAKGFDNLEEGQREEVNLSGIKENISRLTFDKNDEWAPAVSNDGKKLAFVSNRSRNSEIFTKDMAGGGTGETQRTFSSAGQNNLHPFWLSDNENFGFYTNRLDKNKWHLFTSTKGKGLTLISTSVSFIGPEWLYGSASEAFDAIVFTVKSEYNPEPAIWLYEAANTRFTQLVPGLFPDIYENKIVFCSAKSGNYDLWTMELQGNSVFKETQITYHEGWDYDPAWSPDGSKIAFVSHRSGNSDIWLMDMNGANEMQLTFNPMVDRRPQWVDEFTLVFESNRELDEDGNPSYDIWQMRIVD